MTRFDTGEITEKNWKEELKNMIFAYNRKTIKGVSGIDKEMQDKLLDHICSVKEETANNICAIIDDIELDQKGSSFEEWRMYKRIRNTIRDKYGLVSQSLTEEDVPEYGPIPPSKNPGTKLPFAECSSTEEDVKNSK